MTRYIVTCPLCKEEFYYYDEISNLTEFQNKVGSGEIVVRCSKGHYADWRDISW